jgi:hypothetical protein
MNPLPLRLIACPQCGAANDAELSKCWMCDARVLDQPATGSSPFSEKAAQPADVPRDPIRGLLDASLWILAVVLLLVTLALIPQYPLVALLVALIVIPAYGILLLVSLSTRASGQPMKLWVKWITLLSSAAVVAPLAMVCVAVIGILSVVIAIFQICFPASR